MKKCELEVRTRPKKAKQYAYTKECKPVVRQVCEDAEKKKLRPVCDKIQKNVCSYKPQEQLEIMRNIMTDYIKMENEYNTSKKVLAKLKKGLEAENADMNKDVEAEYRAKLQEEMENSGATEEDHQGDPRY